MAIWFRSTVLGFYLIASDLGGKGIATSAEIAMGTFVACSAAGMMVIADALLSATPGERFEIEVLLLGAIVVPVVLLSGSVLKTAREACAAAPSKDLVVFRRHAYALMALGAALPFLAILVMEEVSG